MKRNCKNEPHYKVQNKYSARTSVDMVSICRRLKPPSVNVAVLWFPVR